ncbi:MAG TPA: hypothetical protein DCM05_17365 [Elusimicrobia bacterium]|nr:hypothetical protein [Elusimicrobiota bacterium]
MRVEEVDEPVQVGAVFKGGKVLPRWFVWAGVRHDVSSVNMVWKGKAGEAPLSYFSVSSGGSVWQLRLDHKSMEWRLEKVCSE